MLVSQAGLLKAWYHGRAADSRPERDGQYQMPNLLGAAGRYEAAVGRTVESSFAGFGLVALGTVSALVAEVLHLVGLARGDNHVAPVDHRFWHGVSEGLPGPFDRHDGYPIPLPHVGAAQ
jgi:hypothetical protein